MTETSISTDSIEKHLQSLFTPQIRNKGMSIVGDGAVQEVFVDKNTGLVHATVKSESEDKIYRQELLIHPQNRFLSSASCSCPYGKNCKHSAAVLYQMLRYEVDVVDANDANSGKLEKGSEIFRYLPKDQNLAKSLDQFSYRNREITVNEKIIRFLPENIVQIVCFEKKPYYLGGELREAADVLFNHKEGQLGIKCNSCTSPTQKLCKHQKVALEEFINEVDEVDFLEGKLIFQNEVEGLSEKMEIKPETLLDSYELRFKYKRIILHKTNDALLDQEDMDLLKRRILGRKTPVNEKLATELEKVEHFGNALVWSPSFKERRSFHTIQGKHNKSKTKLSSKLEITDYPRFLKRSELETYNSLNQIQHYPMPLRLDMAKSLEYFVHENLDDVNELVHFVDSENLYPELGKTSLKPFVFSSKRIELFIEVETDDLGFRINGKCLIDQRIPVVSNEFLCTPLFCIIDDVAYFYSNAAEALLINEFLAKPTLYFNRSDEKAMMDLVEEFSNVSSIHFEEDISPKFEMLSRGLKQVYLKEVNNYVIIEPRLLCDDIAFRVLTQKRVYNQGVQYEVNEEERQEFLDIIRGMHPSFGAESYIQDYLYLKLDEIMNNLWFLEFYDTCRNNNIEVFGQEQLTKLNFSPHRAQVSNFIKSGINWFDVDVEMSFGDYQVPMMDWVKAIKDGQKYVKLGDGTLGLIPDQWLNKLSQIVQTAEIDSNGVKISKFKFNIIDQLFDEIDDQEIIQELREKKYKLLSFDYRKKFNLPSQVKAELRPYQEEGFQWLTTLDEIGWGGILADDMGLGKTLQVISLLTHVHQNTNKCSLIVVPRSLIFNWSNELDKFNPNLKYHVHYGLDRNVDQELFYEYDLIITTYTLVVNDIDKLRRIPFHYVILDESQAIKNITSQRFRAACLLQAQNKMCMTGTPIENNTFELYAQMSFVNPGMLGTQKSFKDIYAQPIDSKGDESAADMLRKIISPFLLRRTKEVVAKDLPQKSEIVIYCEMGKTQKRIYDEIKNQVRLDLQGKVEKEGIGRSKMKILEGLLRLRQVCNSPALVKADLPKEQQESIKINTLVEQLTEELNDHNALVFSQFTSMLDLIRKELDARGVKYSYLDGSTRKRKEVVQEFDEDDDIKIFLISLKAGNTGLNLVKADYVYIVDPWWNPAVEAQAIDRTHRIGQDKNIFAYKLVCKGTIEEKILKLQERKKKIATDIIATEENFLKSMKEEDLLALFD